MWVAFMTAITPDGGSKRAVRFDYVPQPVGEGHKQNYPKEVHYLAFVGRAGSESLKGTDPEITATTGVGVNGCRRTKHIVGGDKDEEARRDRRNRIALLLD